MLHVSDAADSKTAVAETYYYTLTFFSPSWTVCVICCCVMMCVHASDKNTYQRLSTYFSSPTSTRQTSDIKGSDMR